MCDTADALPSPGEAPWRLYDKGGYRCGFAWHKGSQGLASEASESSRKGRFVTLARRIALPLAASLAVLSLGACGQAAKEEDKAAPSAAPEAKPGISINSHRSRFNRSCIIVPPAPGP